ncbi:helix-hairpin-helix domain-containing protein [uncultured Algibacter sp.]|uniref:ComEA family DNA-binding protein n=1 Tax=uncultured Algibacter sp. TaxID=298659 RepID=UPI002622013A|nr:helix-hairpin-helix domain-containing protein [uncultured Algibacter sp.]
MSFRFHFMFTKEQRNGIFLLLVLIVFLQAVYFFVDLSYDKVEVDQESLTKFTNEIDSLKRLRIEKRESKLYPFNPNYITDHKGSILGMSNEEIDRLLAYRMQNKWINSVEQFQEVTQVSDSLLNVMSPYFKFPEWVVNSSANSSYDAKNELRTFSQKYDLNTASSHQLQKVNGIGKVLSERIIKFRNKKEGGFAADVELLDVYGLSPEVIESLTNEFTVKTPRVIKEIDLNLATVDDLVTIPHIDYDLAHSIIEQRQLREGYKSVDELTKVIDFPANKIKIIELYLHIEKEK